MSALASRKRNSKVDSMKHVYYNSSDRIGLKGALQCWSEKSNEISKVNNRMFTGGEPAENKRDQLLCLIYSWYEAQTCSAISIKSSEILICITLNLPMHRVLDVGTWFYTEIMFCFLINFNVLFLVKVLTMSLILRY